MKEVSRQRKKQIAWRSQGRCIICGDPALPSTRFGTGGVSAHCLRHLVAARERERKRKGSQKRLTNASSYQVERKACTG